jgi:hypothetical protein
VSRSHFINQCLLFGDNREYNVLLVVPDFAQVRAWVALYLPQVPFSGDSPENDRLLMELKEVKDLMTMEIQTATGLCKVRDCSCAPLIIFIIIISNTFCNNEFLYVLRHCRALRDLAPGPLFSRLFLRKIICSPPRYYCTGSCLDLHFLKVYFIIHPLIYDM